MIVGRRYWHERADTNGLIGAAIQGPTGRLVGLWRDGRGREASKVFPVCVSLRGSREREAEREMVSA